MDAASPDDAAQADGVGFAGRNQRRDDTLRILRGAHHDQPDAHVEGAEHLVARDVTALLEEQENRRDRPRAPLDLRGASLGQECAAGSR